MAHTDVSAWVLSACLGVLRKSQARTLSVLVSAALGLQRVSLANLGRAVSGPVYAKHKIKRAWRFIANQRVQVSDAMTGVLAVLLKRWRKGYRNKPLLVGLDWTDIRGVQTLMAAAAVRGRAVPLLWASCPKGVWRGHKSRNGFEESLLLLLRAMIPKELGVEVLILADRGFGRTELGRFCQRLGLRYVVRIQPNVWIRHGSVRCKLDRYPVHRGLCRKLPGVLYRQHDPLRQHVVVRWKKNLPKRRDECWYLMTDLPQPARVLSDLYAKRMTIEELFRDAKSKRNGWSLRDTGITDPDRLDRLILILAVAYLVLLAVGRWAAASHPPGYWSSNNRPDSLSLFQIGQQAVAHNRPRIQNLIEPLMIDMTNWG